MKAFLYKQLHRLWLIGCVFISFSVSNFDDASEYWYLLKLDLKFKGRMISPPRLDIPFFKIVAAGLAVIWLLGVLVYVLVMRIISR